MKKDLIKIYKISRQLHDKADFHWNINHMGYYLEERDSNGRYSYSHQTGNDWEKHLSINNFSSEYLKKTVSHMFRLPHLTLSRDKLSMLQEKCDFKITRDINKADVVIVGRKTIEKMTNTHWSSILELTTDNLDRLTKTINNSKIKQEHKEIMINTLNDLEVDSYITFNGYRGYYSNATAYTDLEDNLDKVLCERERNYVVYVPNEMKVSYDELTNGHTFMSDDYLNRLCTEDSVVLDKEAFKSVHKLITSTDKENVSVGLTMMANCNEEKSKTYLALLFAFDSEEMKNSKVWTQVNFKQLKKRYEKYINITLSQWGNAYDHIIKTMCDDECLTMFASRVIANTMFKRVLSGYSGAGTRDSVFTLSAADLKLKPEFKDKLVSEEHMNISKVIKEYAGGHNDDLPF